MDGPSGLDDHFVLAPAEADAASLLSKRVRSPWSSTGSSLGTRTWQRTSPTITALIQGNGLDGQTSRDFVDPVIVSVRTISSRRSNEHVGEDGQALLLPATLAERTQHEAHPPASEGADRLSLE